MNDEDQLFDDWEEDGEDPDFFDDDILEMDGSIIDELVNQKLYGGASKDE
jgi:hypothetical protein